MLSKCVEECDDLILWFSEGEYVVKAMELKMRIQPLYGHLRHTIDNHASDGRTVIGHIQDLIAVLISLQVLINITDSLWSIVSACVGMDCGNGGLWDWDSFFLREKF